MMKRSLLGLLRRQSTGAPHSFASSSSSYNLKDILKDLANGRITVETGLKSIENLRKDTNMPAEKMIAVDNFANLDASRFARCGFPEVIFGSGKTTHQVKAIFQAFHEAGVSPIIATKITPEVYAKLQKELTFDLKYNAQCGVLYSVSAASSKTSEEQLPVVPGVIAVMCAGTSDVGMLLILPTQVTRILPLN